ncbi:MAG: glycosyltransferase, partial [Pseudomonadota bacterium]
MQRTVSRIWSNPRFRELAAYLQVSIIATFFDMAVFTALLFATVASSTVAGSVSYLVALIGHYLIAVRFVFRPERTGKSRMRLATEYIATGFVGVSITAAVIYVLTVHFGVGAYAAKAAGIGASFLAVYALRALVVFKPDQLASTEIDALEAAQQEANSATLNYARIRQELATRSHLAATEGMSIAVLLPCYNEEAAIAGTIAEFREALPSATIHVYDNNSKDRTSEVARAAGAVVRHEAYQGKGNVVRRMLADIDADIYVLADGDMTYDATAAGHMVEQLVTQNLDMVVGTRVADADAAFRSGHRFGNRMFNLVVQNLFGTQFSDILSGYRVLSRRFAKSYPASSSGFEIETEFSVHALDLRLSTAEIPLHYKQRPANSVSKLRTYTDGMRILMTIARMYRWLKPRQFYGAIGIVIAA